MKQRFSYLTPKMEILVAPLVNLINKIHNRTLSISLMNQEFIELQKKGEQLTNEINLINSKLKNTKVEEKEKLLGELEKKELQFVRNSQLLQLIILDDATICELNNQVEAIQSDVNFYKPILTYFYILDDDFDVNPETCDTATIHKLLAFFLTFVQAGRQKRTSKLMANNPKQKTMQAN